MNFTSKIQNTLVYRLTISLIYRLWIKWIKWILLPIRVGKSSCSRFIYYIERIFYLFSSFPSCQWWPASHWYDRLNAFWPIEILFPGLKFQNSPSNPNILPKSVYSVQFMYLAAQNAGGGSLYRNNTEFYYFEGWIKWIKPPV